MTVAAPPSAHRQRVMSNSIDHLNIKDDVDTHLKMSESNAAAVSRLDAEPYLHPVDIKRVMGKSLTLSGHSQYQNNSGFNSMRAPKKNRQPLFSLPENKPLENGDIPVQNTHKRSHSNPFMPMTVADFSRAPLELPLKNLDSTSEREKKVSESGSVTSPIESLLEFSALKGINALQKSTSKPLPPIPDDNSDGTPKNVVMKKKIFTSKSMDTDCDILISCPLQDIDGTERKSKYRPGSSLPDLVGPTSAPATSSSLQSSNFVEENNDAEDDQYAHIEEFQQYMQMASVPINLGAAKKPPLLPSRPEAQGKINSASPMFMRGHAKSVSATSVPRPFGRNVKRESMPAIPSISTPKQKHVSRFSQNESTIPEELKEGRKPVSPPHDVRPLPPSPSELSPNGSSNRLEQVIDGSNIYEDIDEAFVKRLTRRTSRKSSKREVMMEWGPPVKRSMWPKYLTVTHTFFNIPQVKELWNQTVESIMEGVNPEDINPPYFNLGRRKLIPPAESVQVKEEPTRHRQGEGSVEEERPSSRSSLQVNGGTVAPRNTPVGNRKPIDLLPPSVPPHQIMMPTTSSGSSASPTSIRLELPHPQPPSPSPSPSGIPKYSVDSNKLIMMLNQCQEYDSDDDDYSSSDAENSEQITDSDTCSDTDIPFTLNSTARELVTSNLLTDTRSVSPCPEPTKAEQSDDKEHTPLEPPPSPEANSTPEQSDNDKQNSPQKQPPKPLPKPKSSRVSSSIKETSGSTIDTVELESVDGNDSNKVSTDFALTKSSLSNGGVGFDIEDNTTSGGGGQVVHNVRPSLVFKNKQIFTPTPINV